MTCEQIEAWRPVRPNRWVLEEQRFDTLLQRISALIEGCDAALALPGGPGTLTEIALMWNLLLTEVLPQRPLILIGIGWENTFLSFYQNHSDYIPMDQRRWLSFVPDIPSAIELLNSI